MGGGWLCGADFLPLIPGRIKLELLPVRPFLLYSYQRQVIIENARQTHEKNYLKRNFPIFFLNCPEIFQRKWESKFRAALRHVATSSNRNATKSPETISNLNEVTLIASIKSKRKQGATGRELMAALKIHLQSKSRSTMVHFDVSRRDHVNFP